MSTTPRVMDLYHELTSTLAALACNAAFQVDAQVDCDLRINLASSSNPKKERQNPAVFKPAHI